ncbi:hypothetical protein LX77_00678 [Gelidibacter algens]|uniref:DUF4149 domain-containing protein n=1 Tax=Gelidibacter algens TaxID=49280 RepID=A0A1A7R5Y8_9FLAO|nr:hypothetical protein [Gelidibacter algens]OBX26889.1 hypothetical protein A9996_02130 [Gelidibacter algens]RAJ26430.1 hypothetical protein LX77_00678 [Gelidibacter algens]
MDIDSMRLLFDTGLLVLIWMVQLLVYPSFRYYDKPNLVIWHKHYTVGLSIIVIPLMFGQLILASVQWFNTLSAETLINLLLVVLLWALTFIQFVPLHKKIADNKATPALLKRLVARNWWRTILWTVIFCWSVYTNL